MRGQTNSSALLVRAARLGASLAVNHLQGVTANGTPVGAVAHTTTATATTTAGTVTDVHYFQLGLDALDDPDAVLM